MPVTMRATGIENTVARPEICPEAARSVETTSMGPMTMPTSISPKGVDETGREALGVDDTGEYRCHSQDEEGRPPLQDEEHPQDEGDRVACGGGAKDLPCIDLARDDDAGDAGEGAVSING